MTQITAGNEGLVFHSHGEKLLGTLFRGAGQGPRPTFLLLHGIPGLEKNVDLAYALREIGWNVLLPHFRGCWGSGGVYALTGIVDDVTAATETLLAHPAVDGGRLALGGLSLGGWATIAAGAAEPRFRALVSMSPLVDPRAAQLAPEMAANFAKMLNGITPDEIQRQWATLTPLPEVAPRLAGRPVLLVGGSRDALFPPAHLKLLADAQPEIQWHTLEGADHSFTLHRAPLMRLVVDWLRQVVGD